MILWIYNEYGLGNEYGPDEYGLGNKYGPGNEYGTDTHTSSHTYPGT